MGADRQATGEILIRNADWVLTVDPERRVLSNGSILVRDGIIAWVGKAGEEPAIGNAMEVIDGRGLLALPGLIDTSIAVVQQLGRGVADLCDIADYRLQRLAAYEGALTPADATAAAEACLIEMIRAGTTCFVDTGSRFPEQIAEATLALGLRGFIARSCQDIAQTPFGPVPDTLKPETTAAVVEGALSAAFAIRALGDSRVNAAIGVPWLTVCSDRLGKALGEAARQNGFPVVVSVSANRDEAVMTRVQDGRTEFGRLLDMELLGSLTIISHAGWTGPEDLPRLVRAGVSIACCPSASHRLGTGALENGRFPELLAFGANVTLGSGSAMGSNFVDIARQLYLFAGGSKTFRLDATVTSPETVLEMATIRAARALGLEGEIGSLEPGKRADIVLFRCLAADWVPVINPLANLTFSARGGADTVIIDGAILLRGGAVTQADERAILDACQDHADAVMDRSSLRRFCVPSWPVL